MGYLKTKGVIIKEVYTGEADKIITIFSGGQGRITAFAGGARRPKSRLASGTQFLCYSDFVLFRGRDMHSVNSCEVIEPFYDIRNDLVKLTYAAHIVELAGDTVQEGQPATKALQLFLNALYMLSKTDKSPELIARIFELRLLTIMGYAPYVGRCVQCGTANLAGALFSFEKCGLICGDCAANNKAAISILPGTARALRHIVHAGMNKLFSFEVSPGVLSELSKILRRYLRERLEKDYTRLDFLKNI